MHAVLNLSMYSGLIVCRHD